MSMVGVLLFVDVVVLVTWLILDPPQIHRKMVSVGKSMADAFFLYYCLDISKTLLIRGSYSSMLIHHFSRVRAPLNVKTTWRRPCDLSAFII